MKKFFAMITTFRWMSLAGLFFGVFLFCKQTENLSVFSLLAKASPYVMAFGVVFIYRLVLWLVNDLGASCTLQSVAKNLGKDYVCFVIMMLCSCGTLFLFSLF